MNFTNEEYKNMWDRVVQVFPILNKSRKKTESTEAEVVQVVELLDNLQLIGLLEKLAFNKVEEDLRQIIAPNFWKHFNNSDNELYHFNQFNAAVTELYKNITNHIALIKKIEKVQSLSCTEFSHYGEDQLLNSYKLLVRATLLSQLPPHYKKTVENFYQIAFKMFCNSDDDASIENKCVNGCMEECQCSKILECFYDTNRSLVGLNLLEPLVGQVLTSLIQIRIENHIQNICKSSFDVSYVESLENWLNSVVMIWLSKIYCVGDEDEFNIQAEDSLKKFEQKLLHFLYETYTRTRINQLFNIIIEYPDSLPAIEDLHNCLPKTDLRSYLINKLERALQTRLLHPGVSTPDILTAYVAAIRSLKILDPSGVLLDIVTQPIHQYLRSREDTVRCVVSSLTEEGSNELADELVKGEGLYLDENCPEEDDGQYWETWNPDPIEIQTNKTPKNRRTSDIISMLVNVYGSKELFVNEYRTLLADRLLSQNSCNTEKEIRYLELLKLRFGETQLHYCEVMLKDIWDSKRINQHLQNDTEYKEKSNNFPVSAMILSAQFWPAFKDETLELPANIQEQLKFFTSAFETLKGNRTLNWKPHLGSVDVDIELKDRTVSLSVSPIHASIIMNFEQKDEWTIEGLSQELHVPATLLRKKIGFWQSQGILKETAADVFLLVEESESRGKGPNISEIVCEEDEAESAMASAQDQREEELQVFWSYIIGMLTNLDSMPLERIHQMLKMFASQGPTAVECSQQELRQFLDRKVREHKLVVTGGYYRLPKT